MKRTTQIIVFSCIAIAVLVGVVLVLQFTAPKKGDGEEAVTTTVDDSNLVLFENEPTNVKELQIKNKLDEYTIEKIGTSDNFTIKAINKANLLADSFTATVQAASTLKAKKVVEENPTDLAQYGFSEPQGEFTITSKDGSSCTLVIGNEAPTDASTYVKEKDKPAVYIFPTSSMKVFLKSRYAYVNTVLMPQYDQETAPVVNKVTIERTDLPKPIVIEAMPEPAEGAISVAQSHKMVSPYEIYVDMTNKGAIVYGMYGLAASEAVWVGLEDVDKELSGINQPSCTVTMQVGGKSYVLTLGKAKKVETTDDNGVTTEQIMGYYGTFSEAPDVLFLFSPTVLPWIDATPESLMAKLFLTPYIYSLDNFTYEDDNQKLVFKVEGNGEEHTFKLNDEIVADEEQIKLLYQYFVGVYGEELYTDSEKGKFIGRITYTDRETKATDVVEFYESSDRKTIININGNNLFKGRAMLGVRLQENVANYLTGKEIVLNY